MDRKIVELAGIIFSAVFVAVFISIWAVSSSLLGMEYEKTNDLYRAEVAFDTSLFDNKQVSGKTILNLKEEMEVMKFSHSLKVNIESGAINADKTYRSRLLYNQNGILSGIRFTEES